VTDDIVRLGLNYKFDPVVDAGLIISKGPSCQIAFEKCVHGKHHRQFSANVGRVRSVPLNRMASLGAIECQVLSQRREFRGMRPLFGRFLRTGQVETAIDQGHVSEGLWKVANQPSCPWIVLLAEKAEIIA
jgi:hypothetical protein